MTHVRTTTTTTRPPINLNPNGPDKEHRNSEKRSRVDNRVHSTHVLHSAWHSAQETVVLEHAWTRVNRDLRTAATRNAEYSLRPTYVPAALSGPVGRSLPPPEDVSHGHHKHVDHLIEDLHQDSHCATGWTSSTKEEPPRNDQDPIVGSRNDHIDHFFRDSWNGHVDHRLGDRLLGGGRVMLVCLGCS